MCTAVLAVVDGPGAGAQDTPRPPGPGITERIVSQTDPSTSFAAFVPSTYVPGEPVPLVLLDPRGRALVPLERMAPAAERLGYLVLSSYDSRSDESVEPTERAVAAMIEDAQDLFTIDVNRLYFAGFSGTARTSWLFGRRFVPYTAGVLGLGAGLPHPAFLVTLAADGDVPFAFYGGAGDLDFNWEEVRSLDAYGAPHFVDGWEGAHAWPGEAVFTRALEWLDTRAVKDGRAERTPAVVARRFQEGLEYAAGLEAEGELLAAWRHYGMLASEYRGLVDVDEAEAALERLGRSSALSDDREAVDRLIDERDRFDAALGRWLERVRASGRPDDVREGIDELGVEELVVRSGSEDALQAASAQRRVSALFVRASFYEPERYMGAGEYDMALAFYEVAEVLRPEDPRVLLGIARSAVQLDRSDRALAALERAADAGTLTPELLEGDPLLAPLRHDPRYVALLERTRS